MSVHPGQSRVLWNADDLIVLAQIVDAGSFTAASRTSGIPKARLSRRIAALEDAFGVRLIERTTRSFRVTDIGRQLYQHGVAMLHEAEQAKALAKTSLELPSGTLHIACPVVLAELMVSKAATTFAQRHPAVQITFDVMNYEHGTPIEHYDIIFLPTMDGRLADSTTIARQIMMTPYELVASPQWLEGAGHPRNADELEGLTGIGWGQIGPDARWELRDSEGAEHHIAIMIAFATNNLVIARDAALAGIGMARLPRPLCREALETGDLIRVVPGLSPAPITVYVAYPSRRSLTAAGRMFLEILEHHLKLLTKAPALKRSRASA